MIVIGKTIKGYWPCVSHGKISGQCDQVIGYPSHPYAMKMNSEYFVALAKTKVDEHKHRYHEQRKQPAAHQNPHPYP